MTLINYAVMSFYMARFLRTNSIMDASKLFKAQGDLARDILKKVKKVEGGEAKGLIEELDGIIKDCDQDSRYVTWSYSGSTVARECDYNHGITVEDIINTVRIRELLINSVELKLAEILAC